MISIINRVFNHFNPNLNSLSVPLPNSNLPCHSSQCLPPVLVYHMWDQGTRLVTHKIWFLNPFKAKYPSGIRPSIQDCFYGILLNLILLPPIHILVLIQEILISIKPSLLPTSLKTSSSDRTQPSNIHNLFLLGALKPKIILMEHYK